MTKIPSEYLQRQKEIEAVLLEPVASIESLPMINGRLEKLFDGAKPIERQSAVAYLAINQVHEPRGVSYTWVPRVPHIARALETYNPQLKSPLDVPTPYTLQSIRFPLVGVTVLKGSPVVSEAEDFLVMRSSDDYTFGFHTRPLGSKSTVVTILAHQSDVVRFGELQVGISVESNPAYNK